MNKAYTAQELREAADNFWVGGIICKVKDENGRVVKHIKHDAIIAMLRQSADLMERDKKYEYAVEHHDLFGKWVVYEDGLTLVEAQKLSREKWARPHSIVRREVSGWEEVREDVK